MWEDEDLAVEAENAKLGGGDCEHEKRTESVQSLVLSFQLGSSSHNFGLIFKYICNIARSTMISCKSAPPPPGVPTTGSIHLFENCIGTCHFVLPQNSTATHATKLMRLKPIHQSSAAQFILLSVLT